MTNLIKIKDLALQLHAGRRLLGIDLGSKTIGIAKSDISNNIATPLITLKRKKFNKNIVELNKIIKINSIYAIIMGLPKNMNNTEGPRCQATRAFVRNLNNLIITNICFWDERGSTIAVTNTLIKVGISYLKRKKMIDKLAASFILQGALDRIYVIRNNLNKYK